MTLSTFAAVKDFSGGVAVRFMLGGMLQESWINN